MSISPVAGLADTYAADRSVCLDGAPALRQSAPQPVAAPRRELDNKVLAAMGAGEKLIDAKCPGLFALGLKSGKVFSPATREAAM